MTNRDVYDAKGPLEKLMKEKFPVKVSYKLALLASVIEGQLNVIENVRRNLVNKYGENDGQNTSVKPNSGNWSSFISEMNELLDQEINLEFEKVKLPEKVSARCEKCGEMVETDFQIEPNTLMALKEFVEV